MQIKIKCAEKNADVHKLFIWKKEKKIELHQLFKMDTTSQQCLYKWETPLLFNFPNTSP